MIQTYKAYLTQLGFITAGFYLVGGLLFFFLLQPYFIPALVFLPILFFFLTFGVHQYLVKAFRLKQHRFTSRFMAVFGIKILFLLMLIVLYVLLFPQQAIPFLVTFFIHYLVYTTFEVVYLVNTLKSNPPEGE